VEGITVTLIIAAIALAVLFVVFIRPDTDWCDVDDDDYGYVETPGGKFISKDYLKDLERLRRRAREEVDREYAETQERASHASFAFGTTVSDSDLTEREAVLVQKFVAELKRNRTVS